MIAPVLIESYYNNTKPHLLRVHMSINLILTTIKDSYFNAHFRNKKTEPREIKKSPQVLEVEIGRDRIQSQRLLICLFVLMILQLMCFPLCVVIPPPQLRVLVKIINDICKVFTHSRHLIKFLLSISLSLLFFNICLSIIYILALALVLQIFFS